MEKDILNSEEQSTSNYYWNSMNEKRKKIL